MVKIVPTNPEIVERITAMGGRVAKDAFIHPGAFLEGPNDIANHVTVYNDCKIGAYTYVNVGTVIYAKTFIGKFCSIGRWVEVGLAQHPVDALTTHPILVSPDLYDDTAYKAVACGKWGFHSPTSIGHDVWVGAKVSVVSGVSVGHGAILAAGCVVTKDVPPYMIVGGVPSRPIRLRFPEPIVQRLLALSWWDMPLSALVGLDFNNIEHTIEILEEKKYKLAQ